MIIRKLGPSMLSSSKPDEGIISLHMISELMTCICTVLSYPVTLKSTLRGRRRTQRFVKYSVFLSMCRQKSSRYMFITRLCPVVVSQHFYSKSDEVIPESRDDRFIWRVNVRYPAFQMNSRSQTLSSEFLNLSLRLTV
jgi:hypothetical protein